MVQNVTLKWNERAPVTVGLAYDDGTVVDLGRNWSYLFAPAGIARLVGNPGDYWLDGVTAGRTTLTVTSGTFSEVVEVEVRGPLAVGLAVSIGPAEPKP